MEPFPSEAVIDIKPEMDDDFIAEDPVEIGNSHGRTRSAASRPTIEIYRAGQSKFSSVNLVQTCRPTESSSHTRQQDGRSSRGSRTGSNKVLRLIVTPLIQQDNKALASAWRIIH